MTMSIALTVVLCCVAKKDEQASQPGRQYDPGSPLKVLKFTKIHVVILKNAIYLAILQLEDDPHLSVVLAHLLRCLVLYRNPFITRQARTRISLHVYGASRQVVYVRRGSLPCKQRQKEQKSNNADFPQILDTSVVEGHG